MTQRHIARRHIIFTDCGNILPATSLTQIGRCLIDADQDYTISLLSQFRRDLPYTQSGRVYAILLQTSFGGRLQAGFRRNTTRNCAIRQILLLCQAIEMRCRNHAFGRTMLTHKHDRFRCFSGLRVAKLREDKCQARH